MADYTKRFVEYVSKQVKRISSENPEMTIQQVLERVYRNEGFLTGRVIVPGLGLELMLRPNEFYLEKTFRNFLLEARKFPFYPLNYRQEVHNRGGLLVSICCKMDISISKSGKSGSAKGNAIFVEEGFSKDEREVVRAHEYGHMIENLGRQQVVYDLFTDPEKVKQAITDEEDFPILCSQIVEVRKRICLKKIDVYSEADKKIRPLVRRLLKKKFR